MGPAPGNIYSFNRYAYANDNPIRNIDPNGMDAQIYWKSSTQAELTVKYVIAGAPVAHPAFTTNQVNATFAKLFSGKVALSNGRVVTVNAKAVNVAQAGKGINVVVVLPTTVGVTPSGRSDTNKIGGDVVRVGAHGKERATATTITHEFGHVSGAGDQYKGGVDVNGNIIVASPNGSDNIMKTLIGNPANNQTMQEIMSAKSNTNICAKDVSAANGGC